MNQEKYTDRMSGFLQSAQMLALREGHQRLVPDHLLKVLLDDPEGLAANLISSAGGDSTVEVIVQKSSSGRMHAGVRQDARSGTAVLRRRFKHTRQQ